MSSAQFNELLAEAELQTLSKEWPPALSVAEKTLFNGTFSAHAWFRQNVSFAAGFIALCVIVLPLFGMPLTPSMVMMLASMILAGCVLTYLIYCRQTWLITDRGIYVKGRAPTALSSIKRIQGFGATVRLTGRFGLSQTLVGVANAAEVRQTLTGRKS